ncbi:unnamed protein product [Sphagnum jensenii]|uniref:Uncharacterized protein n=1 Tax=Sphagnum jensenii TaxID=128206 RepID=A0ABP0V8V1_9BRYO
MIVITLLIISSAIIKGWNDITAYYSGPTTDSSSYAVHYLNYINSAAEQGVAIVGSGDAEREKARLLITDLPNYRLLPLPQMNFTVHGARKWNPADFAIQSGEQYEVRVIDPLATWYDGEVLTTATGYSSYYDAVAACYIGAGSCRSYLRKRRRLVSAGWLTLVCGIGEYVRPISAVHAGKENFTRWLPLDEAALLDTLFPVGLNVQFKALHSGTLMCFANDAQTEYWNNRGSLNVTVVRLSWPPSNSTYYEPLSLPACDAAVAVYGNYRSTGEPRCNAAGGGSGWTQQQVHSNQSYTYLFE